MCAAISSSQLAQIFGGPAKTEGSGDTGCTFEAASGEPSVMVAEFETEGFSVNAQKASEHGGTDLTIAGHPAAVTKENDVVVSTSSSADTPGILKAYTIGGEEEQIAEKLLAALVPRFAH